MPLLRSDYAFVRDNFYSAAAALRGRMWTREGWEHPPGSALIAWAKRVGNSPIVYIQCGNDEATYANPGFRRLLRNAVDWATSADAARWASTECVVEPQPAWAAAVADRYGRFLELGDRPSRPI